MQRAIRTSRAGGAGGRLAFALAGIAAAFAAASAPAAAGPCADRVIVDSTDGRVDGVYALPCYGDALEGLPEDVRAYSSAEDVISRALYARIAAVTAKKTKQPARTAPKEDVRSEAVASGRDLPRSFPLPIVVLALVALAIGFAVSGRLVSRWVSAGRALRRA